MRKIFASLLLALGLSGCQWLGSLGFVPVTSTSTAIQDAGVYCQVQATGVVYLESVDPSLVSHNAVAIADANKICAVIAAIPVENTAATVPVHHTTTAGADAATPAPTQAGAAH
jgi:hypothetical protein